MSRILIFQNSIWLLIGICCVACNSPEQEQNVVENSNSVLGNAVIDEISAKIETSPNDASLYASRAVAYYDNEGFDEAIADFHTAIQLDSTQVDYYHLLADVYLDYLRSRNALETMELAAKRFPDRIPTLLKLSEFYLLLQKHESALKTVDQILRIDRQNPDAYFMLGRTFEDMGDTSRAINSYQTAVENEPDMIDAWIKLGNFFAQKNNKIAIQYYDNALRTDDQNVEAIFAKAWYLHQTGKLNEAIEWYRNVNVVNPQFANAYYNSGLAYLELDSVAQANRLFDMTIKMKPTHFKGYYYRGLTAEMQGNKEDAMNDYQQAVNLNPKYEEAQFALQKLQRNR